MLRPGSGVFPMRSIWTHAVSVVVGVAGLAWSEWSCSAGAPAPASGHEAATRIQSFMAQEAAVDFRIAGRMLEIPPAAATPQSVQLFIRQLFQDPDFARHVAAWAAARGASPQSELEDRWREHLAQIVWKGLLLVSDDDIAFMLRVEADVVKRLPEDTCAAYARGRLTRTRAGAAGMYPPDDATRYLSILHRAYVRALGSEAPQPEPSKASLDRAMTAVLRDVSFWQRPLLEDFLQGDTTLSDHEVCTAARAYFSLIAGGTSDEASQLRRAAVLSRPSAVAKRELAENLSSVPQGNPGFAFEPGGSRLQYPPAALAADVQGHVIARVSVDENGRATRVDIVERAFNKPSVAMPDGSVRSLSELFDAPTIAYIMGGRFVRRGGTKQAYVAQLPIVWTLLDRQAR